jgi:hypothetical protein
MMSPVTIISGTNVTVQAMPLNAPRQVSRSATPGSRHLISKVLIKCTSKENKKDSKTFSLRNVDFAVVTSCVTLKALIIAQLKDDIEKEFDIGYLQGNSIINIRSSDDLLEVWASIRQGKNVVLWCDGLKTSPA